MTRITIPLEAMQFDEGGHTIWFHGKEGTTFRLKTMGKIVTDHCDVSPISHGDLVVQQDITICLSTDAEQG